MDHFHAEFVVLYALFLFLNTGKEREEGRRGGGEEGRRGGEKEGNSIWANFVVC